MRGRYVTSTVAMLAAGLLLLLPVAGAPAKAPAIAKLLPASNELKGWAAIANTDTHCASSKELHKIYNGGDGEYIKAGVTEAYQRTYKNGNVLATVVVHRFGTDWQKAKALCTKRVSGISKTKGFTTVKLKNAGCYGPVPGGQLLGYSWTGYYMVRYEFSSQNTAGAMQAFMKNVTGKVASLLAAKSAK